MRDLLHRQRARLPVKLSPARAKPAAPSRQLVLIVGAPRSGASWLAKIFDSHPNVLYRHEPDNPLTRADLPILCRKEMTKVYHDVAQDYLLRLTATRSLKSAGTLPEFRKDFRAPGRDLLRGGVIYSLHALKILGGSRMLRYLPVPDFIDGAREDGLAIVVKSTSMGGRLGLIAETAPRSRIILVLRHPCGQVASMLRERRLGRIRTLPLMEELLRTQLFPRFGLTYVELSAKPLVEQYAWYWALSYQTMLDELRGRDNVRIVHYEDLFARPVATVEELLAFVGLPSNESTEQFIRAGSKVSPIGRLFGAPRYTDRIADIWRSALSPLDQTRIIAIAGKFEVGKLCLARRESGVLAPLPRAASANT
jgi:hypothetical protein